MELLSWKNAGLLLLYSAMSLLQRQRKLSKKVFHSQPFTITITVLPTEDVGVQFSSKVQKQNKYPVIIISGLLRISKIEVTDVQPIFLAKKQFPAACEFYVFVISKNAKKRIYGELSVFWVLRSVILFQFRKCVVNRNYMVRTSRGQGPLNCGKKATGCHVSQKRTILLQKSTPCLSDNIRETPSWEMKIDTLDLF